MRLPSRRHLQDLKKRLADLENGNPFELRSLGSESTEPSPGASVRTFDFLDVEQFVDPRDRESTRLGHDALAGRLTLA